MCILDAKQASFEIILGKTKQDAFNSKKKIKITSTTEREQTLHDIFWFRKITEFSSDVRR